MAIKMAEADLPHLLSWLEHRLPASFMIHSEVKHHLRGQFPDVDFFVDRWPHPQAVVARVDPVVKQPTTLLEGMFSQNDKALSSLLWDPTVVDWNQRVKLCGMPVHLMPEMLAAAQGVGKSVATHCCMLMKASPQDLQFIPIPEEVKVQPVCSAEVRMIYSTWKFASERSESYVKESVQRFPSVYLVTKKGRHVGHMVGTVEGSLKMLYVNPEFRGKGYAKLIVSQLAQKYFDLAEDAWVFVEEDNMASQNLHKSLGFRAVGEIKLAWIFCV